MIGQGLHDRIISALEAERDDPANADSPKFRLGLNVACMVIRDQWQIENDCRENHAATLALLSERMDAEVATLRVALDGLRDALAIALARR
jgi:hypothetical protein